jgi:hypothetical protein
MRYVTQVIWPPFKGKAHKVIDTETGKSVGLYRTPAGAARKAKGDERRRLKGRNAPRARPRGSIPTRAEETGIYR